MARTLGAAPPNTRGLDFGALLGTVNEPGEVALRLRFSDSEIGRLKAALPQLALYKIESDRADAPSDNELRLVQYLSSAEGRKRLEEESRDLKNALDDLEAGKDVEIKLRIDPGQGLVHGADWLSAALVRVLSRLPPQINGLVSYFPADRELPQGDVNIQLGPADTQQQIQSHLGRPQLKHKRLKNLIVNRWILAQADRDQLRGDFARIFDSLLPGKELAGIALRPPHGNLSVTIRETATGATYDIDNMSSGEKGLLLTFFLARRHIKPGGLILIDEPELHLNPAVCSKILPFLSSEVLKPAGIQALICTHSGQILASAYEREDCTLYQLRSPKELAPIYARDKEEMFGALRALGTGPDDVLFHRGGLYVEGPHDAELLEVGFPKRVSGLKIAYLGGRTEVEKEIRTLQTAEHKGEVDSVQSFIFDRDRKPTDLTSSPMVRVGQWDRYCFENYLLDQDAIYDACKTLSLENRPESRPAVRSQLKELAMSQLKLEVVKAVYGSLEPENAGLRAREIRNAGSYELAGEKLVERLSTLQSQMEGYDPAAWLTEFVTACEAKEAGLLEDWKAHWSRHCNGKLVIEALHKDFRTKVSPLEFKRRIVSEMSKERSDNWKAVDSILASLFGD